MTRRILTTELSGYGARSGDAAGAVQIRIFNDEAELFAAFMSATSVAEFHASERLLELRRLLSTG